MAHQILSVHSNYQCVFVPLSRMWQTLGVRAPVIYRQKKLALRTTCSLKHNTQVGLH